MEALVRRLWQEEEAQDLTEYALLLVLIALAAIVAVKGLATAIETAYNDTGNSLTNAIHSGT
ncbi:MAG: hypothetical protein WCA98_15010 [Candidatus Acidiferrales bacterium]